MRAALVALVPLLVSCGSPAEDFGSAVEPGSAAPSVAASPPPANANDREFVPAIWAVQDVSADRASVTIRAYGVAGGCTGPGRGATTETAEGLRLDIEIEVPADDNEPCFASLPMVPVTVPLPRPLQPGEQVLGECVANDGTPVGEKCDVVRRFASAPQPAGG